MKEYMAIRLVQKVYGILDIKHYLFKIEYVYKAKLRLFSRIGLETLQERSKAIISPLFSCVEADGVTKEKVFLVFWVVVFTISILLAYNGGSKGVHQGGNICQERVHKKMPKGGVSRSIIWH